WSSDVCSSDLAPVVARMQSGLGAPGLHPGYRSRVTERNEVCMQFANPQEARDFLAAHPEVRSIELMLIDANGIPRGKLLHRDELLAIYENGRPLPSSILSLTIQGEDVEESGLVWEVADADCWTYPIPGSRALPAAGPWRAEAPREPAGQRAGAAGRPPPRDVRRRSPGQPAPGPGADHPGAADRAARAPPHPRRGRGRGRVPDHLPGGVVGR